MWRIQNLFFRWWKGLWDKIAPYEYERQPDLPPREKLVEIYKARNMLDTRDPFGKSFAKFKTWERRYRVNPRKGLLKAINRKQRGVSHVG